MERILAELETIQKSKGWSDAKLAGIIGVSPASLCRYKNGTRRVPSLDFIKGVVRNFPELHPVVLHYLNT